MTNDTERKVVQMLNALQEQMVDLVATLYRLRVLTASDVTAILGVTSDDFFEVLDEQSRLANR